MLSLIFALLAASPAHPPPLVIGTYRYPRYDRAVALAPLAELAEKETGRPTQILLLDTPSALAEAVCRGEVHIAMTNLGSFVQMQDCPKVEAVAVLDTPVEILDRYRGVLLANNTAGVDSLATLAERGGTLRYSEVLPGSTSGALVQAEALRGVGITAAEFQTRRMAGTHEAALEDLLAGRSDLAALAEEPWRKLQADDPARASTIRQIWRSEPLPPGPVVCVQAKNLTCKAVQRALLKKSATGAAIALAAGWSETEGAIRFKRYRPVDYKAFVRTRSANR